MTYSDKKNLIDSLKIILNTDNAELIKLMVESVIEKLEDLSVENGDNSNHITLK